MKPLLGPLLGHVTDGTAIAWLRLPRHAPLHLVEGVSRPLTGARAGDPGATRFAPLPPIPRGDGTACGTVPLAGGAGELHEIVVQTRAEGSRPRAPLGTLVVRAAPTPSASGRIAFAFSSCWKADALGDATAAWRDLGALARAGHVDHVLFLGDQIYADETPVRTSLSGRSAVQRALELGPDAPLDRRAHGFRETYQLSWEPPDVHGVLASVPSASIWDDHEIVNGFGSEPWHRLAKGMSIFEAAALAHDEYQGARNPPRLEPGSRAHAFRRGPAAFLTLDLRTHRDAARGVLLGDRQKEAIADWLASPQALSARVLFLAASVPLLHLSRAFHWIRGRSDLDDQWSSRANEPDRAWLLRRLLDYEANGKRRLVMLGGDSHLSTAACLHGADGRARWQVTASPLANRLPALVYPALTLLGRRFHVRVEGELEQQLQAHVVGRWPGAAVGVVTGQASDEGIDLTFELFRPGRRTIGMALDPGRSRDVLAHGSPAGS